MQHLLLERKATRLRVNLRLLTKGLESFDKFSEVLVSDIGDSIERRRLEILETRMVKQLAHRALQSSAIDPRCHKRPAFRDNHTTHILFHERLRFVFLKLILVRLALELHLLDDANLRAHLTCLLHLSHIGLHLLRQTSFRGYELAFGVHPHPLFRLGYHVAFRVGGPLPVIFKVRYS